MQFCNLLYQQMIKDKDIFIARVVAEKDKQLRQLRIQKDIKK